MKTYNNFDIQIKNKIFGQTDNQNLKTSDF